MTRFRLETCIAGSVGFLAVACAGTQPPPASGGPTPAPSAEPSPAPSVAAPAPSTSTSAPAAAAPAAKAQPISKAPFGKVDGKDVDLYTLTNKNGLVMKVTNYG